MNNYNTAIHETLTVFGIPPAAAKITGLLLDVAPYSESHTSLHEQLGLSKAAITGGLQYLDALGAIDYRRDAQGSRKMIGLRVDALVECIRRSLAPFQALASQLHSSSSNHESSDFSDNIKSVAVLCDQLDFATVQLIDEWSE